MAAPVPMTPSMASVTTVLFVAYVSIDPFVASGTSGGRG
jgi:hypothetical protein